MLLNLINKISGFLFTKSSSNLTKFILLLNEKIEQLGKNSLFFDFDEQAKVYQNMEVEYKKASDYFGSLIKDTNLVSKMGIKIKLMEADFYKAFYKDYKGLTQISPMIGQYVFLGGGVSTAIMKEDMKTVDYYLIIIDDSIKNSKSYNFILNHEIGHCLNDHINPINSEKINLPNGICLNDQFELEADLYAYSKGYKMSSVYDIVINASNVLKNTYVKIFNELKLDNVSLLRRFNLSIMFLRISLFATIIKRKLMIIKHS